MADETEIERGVFFDVLGLLTIPLSTRASESRLRAMQNAAAEALRIALEARRPGSRRLPHRRPPDGQVKDSAKRARNWHAAWPKLGNFPKLTQARERVLRRNHRAARVRGTTPWRPASGFPG